MISSISLQSFAYYHMAEHMFKNQEYESALQGFYNISTSHGSDLDLFFACFRIQSCDPCLASPRPCSWCAISQVCVPNTRAPYPFQILAPIRNEDICPLAWRERWEMRAKPFSCRCSSMTLISVVVAVLSTLAGVLLIWLLLKVIRLAIRCFSTRAKSRRKLRAERSTSGTGTDAEQRPLLHGIQP